MQNLVIENPRDLREIMQIISVSGEGIVFVTENDSLIGSVTDGDIRRSLLNGGSLTDSPNKIINFNVKTLSIKSSPVEIHQAFSSAITHVPIVDEKLRIVRILRKGERSVIPLCEPNLGELESSLVNQAIDGNWISSAGAFVQQFEILFSQYIGSKNAVAVSNGTIGLVMALKLLNIGIGDEVLVPNLTFGATANAVIQVGAKPIFVDVLYGSFAIDPKLISDKVNTRTKAIIPVHLYGQVGPLEEILKVANKFNLKVIEDAAEAIGTKYKGKHVGTFGDIGVFSFFANKTITTGEGGMVVFQDTSYLRNSTLMRSHGFSPEEKYWHQVWGSNFRITNLQAAIGVAQMSRINELVEAKLLMAEHYNKGFVQLFKKYLIQTDQKPETTNSYWLYTIRLKQKELVSELHTYLISSGIEVRRVFHPLNVQPAFADSGQSQENFPVSKLIYEEGLCLPSSTSISIEDQDYVIHKVTTFFENLI